MSLQKNNRIIVTGVAGFIGMHLSKSLLEDGLNVFGIDNLNDYCGPDLKQTRLDQLTTYDSFSFSKYKIKNFV